VNRLYFIFDYTFYWFTLQKLKNWWPAQKKDGLAAQEALNEAKKTIKEITGLEVKDITAKIDPELR